MGNFKKIISGALAICMTTSSLLLGSAFSSPPVSAAAPEDEWTTLSTMLDDYKGVYTKDTKMGSPWNTGYSPDGPLMGNGTVYAFMAGDKAAQNLYISRSDMWEDRPSNNGQQYTTFGGITIKKDDGTTKGKNLAIGATATSSSHHDDYTAARAISGTWTESYEGWVSTNGPRTPAPWLAVELPQEKTINRWILKLDGYRTNKPAANEGVYSLESSTDGVTWNLVDKMDNLTIKANEIDRNLAAPVTSKYFRILADTSKSSEASSWTNGMSKIGQFEIYAEKKASSNIALGKAVTVNSFFEDSAACNGSKLTDGNDNDKNTGKWCANVPDENNQFWAIVDLGEKKDIARWVVKHAEFAGEASDQNTSDFKLQYSADGVDNWVDLDSVVDNRGKLTDRNLTEPIKAQYIRLLVSKAEKAKNSCIRIYELELYSEKADIAEKTEFRYEQDMKNAEVLAQSEQGFQTKSWLSARENMIVTEITNNTEKPLPMAVSAWTANKNVSASVDGDMMVASKAGISEASSRESGTGTWEGWTVNVSMASKIIDSIDKEVTNVDSKTNTTTFTLPAGETVTLVTAVEGGKEEGTTNTKEATIAQAKAKVESRKTADALATANEAHREYWKEYWLKSYIDIQDEKVERMYYGMLYMLGCATSVSSENNAGLAAGLFPWTASAAPAWQGDYTTNTDMQRQIHPLVTANRLEGIQNYVNVLEDYWPEAQRRSSLSQHLNWVVQGTGIPENFSEGIVGGALFPTHIGPWGASTEQYNNQNDYWNSPADASSVLMPLVKLWQYNQDETYLQEHLYPMLKSVAVFWENFVRLENGKYVVYGATHEGNPGRNPIFDVDACLYILRNAIDAANDLGVDQDKVAVWQNIIDNMSPVPTFIYNGKETIKEHEGRTPQSPGNTFDGNPVTIQSAYYYDAVGMSMPAADKEKYLNYLAVKNGMGNHRRLTSATRLGYDIHEIMDQLKIGSINPNPSDWSGMRGNNTIGDVGACGMTGIVQDSLLQSNEKFLNIFANWYDDQAASFRRLRARGGFLVDADQNKFGQTTYVKVVSEQGKDCSVLNPWQGQEMEVYEDGNLITTTKTENSLGNVCHFATKANSSYELKPKGKLPATIILSQKTATVVANNSLKLTATTSPEDAVVLWNSDNEEAAVVGNDGTVIALSEGTATITATVEGTEISASCVVTVKPNTTNVAVGAIATASSTHENLSADRAVNGDWTESYEGWTSGNLPWAEKRWLAVELAQEKTISRWVLKLDGYRTGDKSQNTGIYTLQTSANGNDWTDVDVADNVKDSANEIDKVLATPVTGKYFRILVDVSWAAGGQWANGYARINQLELHESNVAEVLSVAAIAEIKELNVALGMAFDTLPLPSQVNVTLSNSTQVNLSVVWGKGDYDETTQGTYTVTGILQLPQAITNPNEIAATCKVTVGTAIPEKEVESIAIEAIPTKTTYKVGERLDVAGGKIAVTYKSKSATAAAVSVEAVPLAETELPEVEIIDMTADMVTGFDTATAGTKTLTVTYSGKVAPTTFAVTVKEEDKPNPPSNGNNGGNYTPPEPTAPSETTKGTNGSTEFRFDEVEMQETFIENNKTYEKAEIKIDADLIAQATAENPVKIKASLSAKGVKSAIESALTKDIEIKLVVPNAVATNPHVTLTELNADKGIFEALKETNRIVTFNVETTDGKAIVTWTFDGAQVITAVDVNLAVNLVKANVEIQKAGITNTGKVVASFNHNGVLPAKAQVTLVVDETYADGDALFLYYYNTGTKALDLISSGNKVANGKVTIAIDHCSDYVLTKESVILMPATPTAVPKTGVEESDVSGWFVMILAMAGGVLLFSRKKAFTK